ncbi:uncharacterized protein LOC135936197 [Cloeon dipterum]|uniref:uncharacterized protein LOC135936197 n=1 Tax=Cloeon dipterum TaxID=197152 RepID=UPI00322006D3
MHTTSLQPKYVGHTSILRERMETGGKLQLVLLSICLQIFTCSCSSLTFQNRGLNSWELLIGANAENEFLYDFCRYDASENIERCKNNPRATVDIRSTCNCTLNHTENAKEGSAHFAVNCNNQTVDDLIGGCPPKLTIIYEQGDVRHAITNVETCSGCVIWIVLFVLSLVISVVFGVLLFMLRNRT